MFHPSERVVGQFPMSVATSLAFEGALGIHPDQPKNGAKLSDFKELWINVRTMFRNFYNAVERGSFEVLDPTEVVVQFIAEMESIQQLVKDKTGDQCKVTFYLSDYIKLDKEYPAAVLRVDSTEKQVTYSKSLQRIVGLVIAQEGAPKIKIYKTKITDVVNVKTLMLTSFAFDLTTKTIASMFLLESFTGIIKSKNQFYTKYYDGKNLPMIPFRDDLLAVFGDSELFRPISSTYRNALKELATKYEWNYTTTTARMRQGIDFLQDKMLAAKLKSFVRS